MYSGGLGSWAAADRLREELGWAPPLADITLLFADTKMEDEDLYRFLNEGADAISCGVTRIEEGRDIWQVFRDERFLGNSRIDPCSRVLKRDFMRRWLTTNCDPADTIVYLGFGWDEIHRLERAAAHWSPWTIRAPLTEPPYMVRRDIERRLDTLGVKPPRLYALGFAHNNCGGGCVKAGMGQFALLHRAMPERYAEWEAHEEELRAELGDVAILTDRTNNDKRPLTLRRLRERLEAGATIPMFDIGGCACLEPPEGADDPPVELAHIP
jgi:hypothetical protein